MSGPWEKYSSSQTAQPQEDSGPWSKYSQEQNASKEEPSMADSIIQGISDVGSAIDSYTGAPARAAIGAIQKRENPITAAYNQFGEDPSLAPTGKDIATQAGIDDSSPIGSFALKDVARQVGRSVPVVGDILAPAMESVVGSTDLGRKTFSPTAADVSGAAIDFAADPTLLIPTGVIARGANVAGKTASAGARAATGAAASVAKATPILGDAIKIGENTASILRESAKNTTAALSKMFNPTIAGDFKDFVKIAEKNGISRELLPEAVEFGPDSVITRAARKRAEGLLGEEHLVKFNQGLDAVRDATEKRIQDIAGGVVPNRYEAGEIIRSGFDKGVDNFFSTIDMTHNKVMEAIPGLELAPEALSKIDSKLSGIEKWAKGRSVRGFTDTQRSQADQVLRAIEAVKAGNGSYKQTVEALRDIGEVAFKSKNSMADIPPDIEKFRDLYFTIDDALLDTVGKVAGKPVEKSLRDTNKAISDFLGEKSLISGHIGNKNLAPEKLFSVLVENGDSKKIDALRKILPPEDFKKIKGAFLASQIRKNADETFTFKGLNNSLRNKKDVLGGLLDETEAQDLGELIKLGSRFGEPVLSTSGTGASSSFGDIYKGVRSGLEGDTLIGTLKNKARKVPEPPPSIPGNKSSQPLLVPKAVDKKSTIETFKFLASVSPTAMRNLLGGNKGLAIKGSYPEDNLKGEKKWAIDGYAKALEHDPTGKLQDPKVVEKIFSDKKKRNALVQASSLTPGSKAMDSAFKKLMEGVK